jgi:hypothetical protein
MHFWTFRFLALLYLFILFLFLVGGVASGTILGVLQAALCLPLFALSALLLLQPFPRFLPPVFFLLFLLLGCC